MTVKEFITQYDMDHENTVSNEQKVRWLQRIEISVMSDVMHRYNNHDKSGVRKNTILHSDDIEPLIENEILDISEDREVYIDSSNNIVMTSYDPMHGQREADTMDVDTFLQIPVPYDNVYEYYLDMMIAHATGDIKTYNNSAELFNRAYTAFRKYYARNNFINRNHNHLIQHEAL